MRVREHAYLDKRVADPLELFREVTLGDLDSHFTRLLALELHLALLDRRNADLPARLARTTNHARVERVDLKLLERGLNLVSVLIAKGGFEVRGQRRVVARDGAE